jgi:hypothetical protein
MTGSGYMIKPTSYSFLLVFMILIITGCSSTKSTPVIPENPQADINLPATELNTSESSRSILGAWTLSINHETLEATVTPNRSLDRHYNVKYLIPTPEVVINTIHPNYVIDADVTLTNPYTFPAYDVRLIIFTDEYGHFLDNADAWTDLYDIPVGQDINPFKAYAKDRPNRIFEGESQHTENLLVFNPPPGHPIQFAIDASHPGNCEEPYAFENFQQDVLNPHIGANAAATIDVLDWQHDVSEVFLQCPEITNEPETPFVYDSLNSWKLNLVNNTGAPVGEYDAIIYAKSTGAGNLRLTDRIKIIVSDIYTGIPDNPQLVSYIQKPMQRCTDIFVRDHIAYTINSYTAGFNCLYIVDISDYDNPSITGEVVLPGDLSALTVSGNYAFVSNNDSIQVVNISNPSSPEIVNVIPNYFGYLDSNDTLLFVAMSNIQIEIFDISNITNIYHTSSVLFEYSPRSFDVTNGHLYANTYYGYLSVYNLSDPASPQLLVHLRMGDNDIDYIGPTVVENDKLFFSYSRLYSGWPGDHSRNDLFFVDVSNPASPQVKKKLSWYDWDGHDIMQAIEASGDTLYVLRTGPGDDFIVYDVSNLSNPTFIFASPYMPSMHSISVDGSFGAYKTNQYYYGQGKFGIFNLSNLSDIQWKLMIDDYYDAYKVKTKDNYLYSTASNGLRIADITDPENPYVVSEILDEYVSDFEFVQDTILLAHRRNSSFYSYFASIDISDPINPTIISDVPIGDFWVGDLAIQGNIAFAACYGNEKDLKICDISDTANPIVVSTIPASFPRNIHLRDDILYFTSDNEGFQVIDISDIFNPVVITSIPIEEPRSLAVSGNYAYITEDLSLPPWYKFKIINISDPFNLTVAGECDLAAYADSIVVENGFAYLGINSVRENSCVIDVRDPSSPEILSYLVCANDSVNVAVKDNYAFIACENYGIQINKLW